MISLLMTRESLNKPASQPRPCRNITDLFRDCLVINPRSIAICAMTVSYSPAVHSYISGKLDTLLETDQTSYYSRSRIEEQADINWSNNENNMNAGLQFDLRYEELEQRSQINKQTDPQINQLFFSHKAEDFNYTLGRFNRSDLLGFYTLDGVAVKYSRQNWDTSFHAGKPLQIEDYNIIDAGKIYGLDINHHANNINNSTIQKIDSYLGWQQLQDDVKQNYLHWGISGNGERSHNNSNQNELNQIKMFFNGSYLVENKSAESINAGIQSHSKEPGLARITYTSWKPEQAILSFKEQFYSVYASGKQSILQADYFYDHKWNQQFYIKGRKVWREFGNNGYGATAGFEQKAMSNKNSGWQTQWDSLVLKDDVIHSLYAGFNKNISATLRGRFNTALQYVKKESIENNRIIALEAVIEQMLNSDLFIDFNARYIYNDNLKNEYRIGFRLSYRFDDRIWSRQ